MAKRAASVLVAVLLAGSMAIAFAPSVSAQTTPTTSPFSCSFSVSPTTLPPGGGVVTITGVAPRSTTVRVFLDGVLAATTVSSPVTGAWSVSLLVTTSVEISVALDGYPSTPCIGVGGEQVERGGGGNSGSIVVGGASAQRSNLAFTGSSDTEPLALIGFGVLSLGIVLVVAARRRAHVHGRA